MGQIKVFGLASQLNRYKAQLSDIIHECVVDNLKFPVDKRFHRFFPMNRDDFYFPESRSEKYTIIEISVFEGRSEAAKKALVKALFAKVKEHLVIDANDIEITIFETPKCNWGIRGLPGDELALNYKLNV
jgi:phenylpyruvate tautomerase PptA (4-oxalocrotonate tautomerase family)